MRPPRALHDGEVTIVKVTEGTTPNAAGVAEKTTTPTPWKNVSVQQTDTTEHVDNRDVTVVEYRVSGPIPSVVPVAHDTIIYDGLAYEIVGEPDTRRGRLRINHTSLLMQRATG